MVKEKKENTSICLGCGKRGICHFLCPEAEIYASQDNVRLREMTIGIPRFGQRINEIWEQKNFTFREKQIIALVVAGFNRKDISQSLNITRENVKTHLYRINQKIETKIYTT